MGCHTGLCRRPRRRRAALRCEPRRAVRGAVRVHDGREAGPAARRSTASQQSPEQSPAGDEAHAAGVAPPPAAEKQRPPAAALAPRLSSSAPHGRMRGRGWTVRHGRTRGKGWTVRRGCARAVLGHGIAKAALSQREPKPLSPSRSHVSPATAVAMAAARLAHHQRSGDAVPPAGAAARQASASLLPGGRTAA